MNQKPMKQPPVEQIGVLPRVSPKMMVQKQVWWGSAKVGRPRQLPRSLCAPNFPVSTRGHLPLHSHWSSPQEKKSFWTLETNLELGQLKMRVVLLSILLLGLQIADAQVTVPFSDENGRCSSFQVNIRFSKGQLGFFLSVTHAILVHSPT